MKETGKTLIVLSKSYFHLLKWDYTICEMDSSLFLIHAMLSIKIFTSNHFLYLKLSFRVFVFRYVEDAENCVHWKGV